MELALTLPKVDRRDPTPKYVQAREILVAAIRSGKLTPGVKLPSTMELSSIIDISLITAHKALEGLVESGWLRREVGRGTFVREDVNPADTRARPLSLGLVLDHQVNIDDYYHSSLINGLRREARERDERVEFFFSERFDLQPRSNKDIGAICIHPPLEAQAEVEAMARRVPTVVLGGRFPRARVACIDCDNEAAGRLAVQHLLRLGHSRFLVVSGPLNLSNSADRTAGALAELTAHGLRLPEADLIVVNDAVVMDSETLTRLGQRLTAGNAPTAIVAGGFYLALATMQAVRRAGLTIPRDVSIVGFDDPASAPLLDPPLTTLRQPLAKMAARAFAWISRAIDGGTKRIRVEKSSAELVVRGSTGPAPDA